MAIVDIINAPRISPMARITLRRRDALGGIDWKRYTHIVFPGGDYEDYEPEFAERLRLWVQEGGTAIGLRDAAPWLRATTLDWIDPDSEVVCLLELARDLADDVHDVTVAFDDHFLGHGH